MLAWKTRSKMVKVEAKCRKRRQNVASESRIKSGSKMLKMEAKSRNRKQNKKIKIEKI